MSELRQDPTTYDWVIIAKERAKRPYDFAKLVDAKPLIPSYSGECPFCPGNEAKTPPSLAVYGKEENWKIRVVPNKFAALTPEGDNTREGSSLMRKIHGYGRHEIVIETPLHNTCIARMTTGDIEELIKAYRDRYNVLKKDSNIKVIILFKNHGQAAGTSLEHPHTQIVASPIVPPFIRRRYEIATQHYDNTGHCLYCDILKSEIDDSVRIVDEKKFFVALHPFASRYPFETWIMPKIHSACFGNILGREIEERAGMLRETLLK